MEEIKKKLERRLNVKKQCNCSPEEFREAALKSLCDLVMTVIKRQYDANS